MPRSAGTRTQLDARRSLRPFQHVCLFMVACAAANLAGWGLTFTPNSAGARRTKPGIEVKKMSKELAEQEYKISSWGTWGCDISKFDWTYSGTETAYILEGE